MSVASIVAAETGLDLTNPKLVEEELAPRFKVRMMERFPFIEQAEGAIASVMNTVRAIKGGLTVAGAYTLAMSTLGTAASFMEGRLDEAISENFRRMEVARTRTIESHVNIGDWSVVVGAGGRPVGDVDMYDQVGGWSREQFVAQYAPGIVWMAKRPARSDVMQPTWPSPPYTNGFGFMEVADGASFRIRSVLAGHNKSGLFFDAQPSVAGFPEKYAERYTGTMPAATLQELQEMQGPPEKRLRVLLRIIEKAEAAFASNAWAPPPDYSYLFSVGTYPHYSWQNQVPGDMDPACGAMAVLAAGIHCLSPVHAMVRASRVAQCYKAWLLTSRLRELPPLPKKQTEGEVYLDAEGLPYSTNPFATMQFVGPIPPGQKQDPYALPGLSMTLPVAVAKVRAIEQSYRSFFAVRRAALFQMSKATDTFKAAATKSPDKSLRNAAGGAPPLYTPWDPRDPLGDGWLTAAAAPASLIIPKKPQGGKATVPSVVSGGMDGGGVVIAAGAAAALWWWLRR